MVIIFLDMVFNKVACIVLNSTQFLKTTSENLITIEVTVLKQIKGGRFISVRFVVFLKS